MTDDTLTVSRAALREALISAYWSGNREEIDLLGQYGPTHARAKEVAAEHLARLEAAQPSPQPDDADEPEYRTPPLRVMGSIPVQVRDVGRILPPPYPFDDDAQPSPQPGAGAVRAAAEEERRAALRGGLYTAWMMGRTYPLTMSRSDLVDVAWSWIRQVAPELEAKILLAAPHDAGEGQS